MPAADTATPPTFGLIVVGDEILSGKRSDRHLPHFIELLRARQLALGWAEYVGDEPERITSTLRRVFASADVVLCTGGIGVTPDDHTRQCAAAALGVPLTLHPRARALIVQRTHDVARDKGEPCEPQRADNLQRLSMGMFPQGARIVPNPYNKIPGFAVAGPGGASVYFVPGFPIMAWPMMAWVLDTDWRHAGRRGAWLECSVIVQGGLEATLTSVMQRVEAAHPGVKVFSLPSLDHPEFGAHIELGVKGAAAPARAAYADLRTWLRAFDLRYGPELVRE